MNKTLVTTLSVFIFVSFVFTACHKGLHCIDGNKSVVTEIRETGSFSRILSEGSFDIIVTQDSVFGLEVEAESNLMSYIVTRVQGNTLEVTVLDKRCINPKYPIKVYVKTPDLNTVVLEGSGSVIMNEFHTDLIEFEIIGSGDVEADVTTNELKATIVGSGNMKFRGSATLGNLVISGSGSMHAYEMVQHTCFINISGSGSMFVHVTDLLDVTISGSGTVYYTGNPSVVTNITGSGSVIHQ